MTDGAEIAYSGRDNLEAMEAAVRYNDYLLRLITTWAQGERLLDFGAGSGTFARRLKSAGVAPLCLEPDPSLRQSLQGAGLDAVANLDAVESESQDFIYSLNVLEHIEDDRDALRQLYARLKPGGTLFIYVPAFQLLYSAMDRKVGHFRRYRMADLAERLISAGFTVTAARYVDCLGFFASLLYKLAGNRSGDINAGSVRAYDRLVFPLSQLLDHLFGRLLGKNLMIVGRRPGARDA